MSGAIVRRRTADSFRAISATGGTITTITVNGRQFRVHSFLSSGSFVVSDAGTESEIEWLCVAGGGGGGQGLWGGGGGGGGGGMLEGSSLVTVRSYSVVVGAGGRGQEQPGTEPNQGRPSSIESIVSTTGGGRGARTLGGDGGSGSGGGAGNPDTAAVGPLANTPGSGIEGQGHDGGFGLFQSLGVRAAGGGGGASAVGESASTTKGGDGGPGRLSSIRTGSDVRYAGGGGGGHRGTAPGAAGDGGGGAGGATQSNGGNGAVNTGGGGGGGSSEGGTSQPGGNGGSGIVVIRYPLEAA